MLVESFKKFLKRMKFLAMMQNEKSMTLGVQHQSKWEWEWVIKVVIQRTVGAQDIGEIGISNQQ